MNQALKQRLVGAVVLLALAVIFLPALFNGGRQVQMDTLTEVPPAPVVEPVTIEAPVAENSAPALPASDLYAMEPNSSAAMQKIQNITHATAKPGLDSKKHPDAWVLQVGVFSDKARADELKKNLQGKGYRAFTRTLTAKSAKDKKTVTRVMIGPELELATVLKFKTAVDKEYAVKSLVAKFEP